MWRTLSLILAVSLVLGTVSLVLVAGANKPTTLHSADLKIHDPIRQGNLTIFQQELAGFQREPGQDFPLPDAGRRSGERGGEGG